MERKKERTPSSKVRFIPYRVIYGDTDCGGVVYYGNYLRIFEVARTEFLRENGITYSEVEREFGIILPVVEVGVRYKVPARYDDLLSVKTVLEEVRPFKVKFSYEVLRDGQSLAEGFTVHVPVGRDGRLRRFPRALYEELLKIVSEDKVC